MDGGSGSGRIPSSRGGAGTAGVAAPATADANSSFAQACTPGDSAWQPPAPPPNAQDQSQPGSQRPQSQQRSLLDTIAISTMEDLHHAVSRLEVKLGMFVCWGHALPICLCPLRASLLQRLPAGCE